MCVCGFGLCMRVCECVCVRARVCVRVCVCVCACGGVLGWHTTCASERTGGYARACTCVHVFVCVRAELHARSKGQSYRKRPHEGVQKRAPLLKLGLE